jgi:Spy/CpxP family protein refolding chaperone
MLKKLALVTFVTAGMLFMIGYGVDAFAGWGGGGRGPCWGAGGGYGGSALSAEQYQQMDAQRQAFFAATADLRQQIYEKDLALRQELAKENPDVAAAGKLQKELSKLEGDLEQKRLEHMIAMRQINPNAGKGYTARGSRGPGAGGCGGGGGGPRCW